MAYFITPLIKQHVPEKSGEYDPPSNAWYAQVNLSDASFYPSVVKRVIGSQGKAMKAITHQAGVSYMWYFPDDHSVGIWVVCDDPDLVNERIQDAKRRVVERERYILSNYRAQAMEENYNMQFPALGLTCK
jgi:hypothetical protein